MPEERMRFVKVRTRKEAAGGAKTLYLQVISITPAGILGRKISPKSLEDRSFMDAAGTIHDLQDLIHKSALDWHQKMVEALKTKLPFGP